MYGTTISADCKVRASLSWHEPCIAYSLACSLLGSPSHALWSHLVYSVVGILCILGTYM